MLHIVSFSGGKDSSAMLLRMIEIGMPVDMVLFADTGKEFPQLYAYVDRMEEYVTSLGIEFRRVAPEKTWDDWFYGTYTRGFLEGQQRGWPKTNTHCWWSREAKLKTMDPICKGNYRYIGFGVDEKKRVEAGRKKEGYCFPLADWGWTEAQALEYLIEVEWAEQFHLDFKRTGCFFCPYQREKSLQTLFEKYPEQWAELLRYAKDAPNDFKPGVSYDDLKAIERGLLPSKKPKDPNQICIKFDG